MKIEKTRFIHFTKSKKPKPMGLPVCSLCGCEGNSITGLNSLNEEVKDFESILCPDCNKETASSHSLSEFKEGHPVRSMLFYNGLHGWAGIKPATDEDARSVNRAREILKLGMAQKGQLPTPKGDGLATKR